LLGPPKVIDDFREVLAAKHRAAKQGKAWHSPCRDVRLERHEIGIRGRGHSEYLDRLRTLSRRLTTVCAIALLMSVVREELLALKMPVAEHDQRAAVLGQHLATNEAGRKAC
jgi:hypothetical protein